MKAMDERVKAIEMTINNSKIQANDHKDSQIQKPFENVNMNLSYASSPPSSNFRASNSTK